MPPNYEVPDEFLEAADRFVNLANEPAESASSDWVRAVMMYAAARYTAFTWLTGEGREFPSVDAAAAYFRGKYGTMFRENVKEMEPVYHGGGAGSAS
jgi:hypothetical protein